MLRNKSTKSVLARWNGGAVTVEPGTELDVRDFPEVVSNQIQAVEDRMMKKYHADGRSCFERCAGGTVPTPKPKERVEDDGASAEAVAEAIEEGEARLKDLGEKTDPKSKAERKTLEKKLAELKKKQ